MRKEYFQIGFGVSALLALISFVIFVSMSASDPIDEDFCPIGRDPQTHGIVVIDATDPRTPAQIEALRNRVEALREDAARGDRLTLVELTENPTPTPAFSKCSPGTRDECGIAEECLSIEADYLVAYQAKMNSIVRSLAVQTTRPETPLLEALKHLFEGDHQIARELVPGGLDQNAENVRLILFTDGVEYRRGADKRALNFIARPPDIEAVAEEHPELLNVDLSRVSVEMLTIPRDYGGRPVQTRALWRFWDEYFERTGARSYRRSTLPAS